MLTEILTSLVIAIGSSGAELPQASPSVFIETSRNSICTGTYIGDDKFLTAGHCIDDRDVVISTDTEQTIEATAVALALPEIGMPDAAILIANGPVSNIEAASVNCSYEPVPGDTFSVTSYPFGMEIKADGVVLSTRYEFHDTLYVVDIPAGGGSSGSGLMDSNEIIGILVAIPKQGVGMAIATAMPEVCRSFGLGEQ